MSSAIERSLYDLLLYWTAALLSAIILHPVRMPPLLLYLVFGALLGNFEIVDPDNEAIEFFAEWSITIVFFALGFEETVEHFLEGLRKAWGIASIGAFVPFGCGYLCGVIFFPDEGWYVHLTLATAVTATAVSLTMMVLQSADLLKTNAALGIITSAVLDDVGCLILVSILVPVVTSAAENDRASSAAATSAPTNGTAMLNNATMDPVTTTAAAASAAESLSALDVLWILAKVIIFFICIAVLHKIVLPHNVTEGLVSHVPGVRTVGIKHLLSYANGVHVPLIIVTFGLAVGMMGNALGFHPTVGAYFAGLILEEYYFDIDPEVVEKQLPDEDDEQQQQQQQQHGGGAAQLEGQRQRDVIGLESSFDPANRSGTTAMGSPNGPEGGDTPAPARPQRRASRLQMTRHAGLFDNAEPPTSGHAPPTPTATEDPFGDVEPDEMVEMFEMTEEPRNTMEQAKEAVGSASFMWLGPVFFVHLGATLEIRGDLVATGVPQGLGIAAILWVGQWISATIAARYVPGGFAWHEAALVGFGMLGRAELFFVVLNIARKNNIISAEVFFPFAVAAMFMNISLPISITIFKPFFVKADKSEQERLEKEEEEAAVAAAKHGSATKKPSQDLDATTTSRPGGGPRPRKSLLQQRHAGVGVVPSSVGPEHEMDEFGPIRNVSAARRRRSGVSRRGIGLQGVDIGPEPEPLPPGASPSTRSRVGSRVPSRLVPRSISTLSNSQRDPASQSPASRQGSRLARRPTGGRRRSSIHIPDDPHEPFDMTPPPHPSQPAAVDEA